VGSSYWLPAVRNLLTRFYRHVVVVVFPARKPDPLFRLRALGRCVITSFGANNSLAIFGCN
jgi:hypothetical protein